MSNKYVFIILNQHYFIYFCFLKKWVTTFYFIVLFHNIPHFHMNLVEYMFDLNEIHAKNELEEVIGQVIPSHTILGNDFIY